MRQKIALGYAIVLAISAGGTTLGATKANFYHREAVRFQEDSLQEMRLIHRLQTNLILIIAHQNQLIYLLKNPSQFSRKFPAEDREIQEHKRIVDATWKELKFSYENTRLNDTPEELAAIAEISDTYESVILNYFKNLDLLLKNPRLYQLTPENREEAEQLLVDFHESESFEQLEDFILSLETVVELVEGQALQAEAAMKTSEKLQIQMISMGIIVSLGIAILLAIYTSRAVTYPIKILTETANRVRQDSNFDLQAPKITEDEIGELTETFNHLILRINDLLESQTQAAKIQLIQQEKLLTLGRLVAEVAHEINNPVNFIYGNLIHAIEYADNLLDLLETYEAEIENPPDLIRIKTEEIDRDFIGEDLPKLLQSMKLGAERTREIVLTLKNFSRLDEREQAKPLNLLECLDSSLLILNHRLKKEILVTKDYQSIPRVEGYMSSICQVFVNIIGNAIDALSGVEQPTKEIKIATESVNSEQVAIRIQDNGPGISKENQQKIFESFFTTKPANEGTGLGLSISREIIEEKHRGRLLCRSTEGVGTEFIIILPIKYSPKPTASRPENNQNSSRRDRAAAC